MARADSRRRTLFVLVALLCAALPPLVLVQAPAFTHVADESDLASELPIWKILFTDSFETNFPGASSWTGSIGPESGELFWIATPITSSLGSRSIRVSGGLKDGQAPSAGTSASPEYASSILANGPIDVSSYQQVRLSLDLNNDSQRGKDVLFISTSPDGVEYTDIKTITGSTGQWQSHEIYLNPKVIPDRLWIQLATSSDQALTDGDIFIDNLKVEGMLEDNLPVLFPVVSRGEDPTPVPGHGWLGHINQFRAASNLQLLSEEAEWSEGAWLHSRYMVLNDYVGHYEDSENSWYTAAGETAAKNSNVFVTSWLDSPDETAIDFWMVAPFHAVSILDPQLRRTGFGSYREDSGYWRMAGTLDVRRGIEILPEGTSFPIFYPPNGGQTRLTRYYGGEFPDPLAGCPNYSPPTGLPIILQLGPGDNVPEILSHSFESDGQILESCLFDETSYVNSNAGSQSSGRAILNNRDAVVIIPRQPLTPGTTYTVKVSTPPGTIIWSFTTEELSINYGSIDLFDQQVK